MHQLHLGNLFQHFSGCTIRYFYDVLRAFINHFYTASYKTSTFLLQSSLGSHLPNFATQHYSWLALTMMYNSGSGRTEVCYAVGPFKVSSYCLVSGKGTKNIVTLQACRNCMFPLLLMAYDNTAFSVTLMLMGML